MPTYDKWALSDPQRDRLGVREGSSGVKKGSCKFASTVFFLFKFFSPIFCSGSAARGLRGSRVNLLCTPMENANP